MNLQELRERQSWTLEQKIDHSLGTIEAFVSRMGGVDKVYVAFSGGKDSTVLLDLCRKVYPNIQAVFCNTGNEYPDIVRFVRQKIAAGENIQIIRPKMTPREVWAMYGFPLVGKESAEKVHKVRINPNTKTAIMLMGDTYYSLGAKWKYLVDELYETSHMCCNKLKKEPFHAFEKENGRRPILGVMDSESKMRAGRYVRNGGCNVFGERPASNPLSIWLEQDIWAYIDRFNLPIAEIYRKGAQRTGCMGCGFGAQFADDTRFRVLLANYPKCYDMVMNYTNNGVTFREALRKMLAVNKLYLPDEQPRDLFSDIISPWMRRSEMLKNGWFVEKKTLKTRFKIAVIDYMKTEDARAWLNDWFRRWTPTLRTAAVHAGYDEDGISQLIMRLYGGDIVRRVLILSQFNADQTTRWIFGTVRRYSRYADRCIVAGRMRLYSVEYEDIGTRGVE